MDLISCKKCGIVLDKSILEFPDGFDLDTGMIKDDEVIWNDDLQEYIAVTSCPVCNGAIPEKE